jgi:hypothetical protein
LGKIQVQIKWWARFDNFNYSSGICAQFCYRRKPTKKLNRISRLGKPHKKINQVQKGVPVRETALFRTPILGSSEI